MSLSACVLALAASAALLNCGDDDDGGVGGTKTDAAADGPRADGSSGGVDANRPDTSTPRLDASPGDASPDVDAGPAPFATRPSKSGTIAISPDDTVVAMINPEDNSVSFFRTSDDTKISTAPVGTDPSSIVIAADNSAYVANRGAATVQRITNIGNANPQIGAAVAVGSEPVGLALSPSGLLLFVTEFAEDHVSVIDTPTMTRRDFASNVRNPRGIVVTNNADQNDADESVVITEFFGTPNAAGGGEGSNDSRVGHVRVYGTDGVEKGTVNLAPITNTEATFAAKAAPNQLFSVAVNSGSIYVTSISAAPALPIRFDQNLYAVVHVADLATRTETTTGAGTANLSQLVMGLPVTPQRFFLGDTVDIDFVPGQKIAYSVSRAADVIQRIDYTGAAVAIGSTQAKQIDVSAAGGFARPCQVPSGIAISGTLPKGYVNCWGSRMMATLDFTSQAVSNIAESTAFANTEVDKGRRFFFTGRGRWSGNGTGAVPPTQHGISFSACASCHPDGLTDNMTWVFAAGPRQSISLDGSFGHGAGGQKQRIFNWTAIIDEMHDFESNTRGVSGGIGVITDAPSAGECNDLSKETRHGTDDAGATLPAPLGGPAVKQLQDGTAGVTNGEHCTRTDWDDIQAWVKTIRPPKKRQFVADAQAVARGLVVFNTTARCDKCHSGAGFTISHRFYEPLGTTNANLIGADFDAGSAPAEFQSTVVSANLKQIQPQLPKAGDNAAPDDIALIPPTLSCAIRNVQSFGARIEDGGVEDTLTLALEVRPSTANPGGASTRAQGKRGYNIPSLYGLATGAPFLHHGQAATLEALFTDTKFQNHWKAGSPNFDPSVGATTRADLIAYLLSIDAQTAELQVPAGFNYCPTP